MYSYTGLLTNTNFYSITVNFINVNDNYNYDYCNHSINNYYLSERSLSEVYKTAHSTVKMYYV